MIRRLFVSLQWFLSWAMSGEVTAVEIRRHIERMESRRQRLTNRSMTLAREIAYWRTELRRRRAPAQDLNTEELGI